MKFLSWIVVAVVLFCTFAACSKFRKQNPLDVKCPSCGYFWDRSPER